MRESRSATEIALSRREMTRDAASGGPAQLRVVHVVPPNFGYTFSGTTNRILMLVHNWSDPSISMRLFGSAFPGSVSAGTTGSRHHALWGNATKNTLPRRLMWTIRLVVYLAIARDYDIVHVHVQWWGGLISPLIAHLSGRKAIYHISLWGSDNPSAVASETGGGLKLSLLKSFDGVVGLTPALVRDCRRHGFSSLLLVAPNFCRFPRPDRSTAHARARMRRQLNISPQAQVVLFVGSIIQRKGVDLVVDAFLKIASRNSRLVLVLVGPRTEQENPRIDESYVRRQREKLAREGMEQRVVWAGLVRETRELSAYYQSADIFLFPSRAEGQGNVIVEAMASGLPIVTTNLPGITDSIVTSGREGYLVGKDDLTGLLRALQTLLRNRRLRLRMGTAAREKALTSFGFEEYCRALSAFYREIAEQGSCHQQ